MRLLSPKRTGGCDARIILEWFSNRPPLSMTLHAICGTQRAVTIRGRRSIWWCWGGTFCGRRIISWCWSVTFSGSCISWCSSVPFCCRHMQYLVTPVAARIAPLFHVLRLSKMNVIVSVCFAFHRLPRAMSNRITSHDTTGHKKSHHIKMTWHDMTPHHITRHDMTSRNYITTLPHLTSPQNQPHYFISPRSQPHDITYSHIPHAAHSITTTDTPRKHSQPPPKRHHQTERPKAGAHKNLGLGIALVGRPAHIL